MAVVFPFSAIVGQDEMKLAILIAAVDASVGAVPCRGAHTHSARCRR